MQVLRLHLQELMKSAVALMSSPREARKSSSTEGRGVKTALRTGEQNQAFHRNLCLFSSHTSFPKGASHEPEASNLLYNTAQLQLRVFRETSPLPRLNQAPAGTHAQKNDCTVEAEVKGPQKAAPGESSSSKKQPQSVAFLPSGNAPAASPPHKAGFQLRHVAKGPGCKKPW